MSSGGGSQGFRGGVLFARCTQVSREAVQTLSGDKGNEKDKEKRRVGEYKKNVKCDSFHIIVALRSAKGQVLKNVLCQNHVLCSAKENKPGFGSQDS